MIILHFLPTLTLFAALKVTIGDSAANLSIAIIALLIAIIGPFAGSYMFIKNANKMFGMMSNGVNKLGSPFKKFANGFANNRFKRSLGSQTMDLHNRIADNRAKQRTAERLNKNAALRRIAGLGLDKRGRSTLDAYAAGQDRTLFNESVEQAKLEYQKYDTKEQVLEALMEGLEKDQVDAAHMKAALESIAGYSGGGTTIDMLSRGQGSHGKAFLQAMQRGRNVWTDGVDDPFTGFGRSIGGDFGKGSPDAAAFYSTFGTEGLDLAVAGHMGEFTGENWVPDKEVVIDGKKYYVNRGPEGSNRDLNHNGGYVYHAQRLATNAPTFGKSQAEPLRAAIKEILGRNDQAMAQELAAAKASGDKKREDNAQKAIDEKKNTVASVNSLSRTVMGTVKDPPVRDVLIEAQKMVFDMGLATGDNMFLGQNQGGQGPQAPTSPEDYSI